MKIIAIAAFCVLLSIGRISYGDIAFVANVEGNWDLYYTDDEGRNLIQLTATPFDEKDPSWSADRKKIVYASSDGHLNVVNALSKEICLVDVGGRQEPKFSPSFSPDGRQIAFVQFRPPAEGDDTDLLIFDLDTNSTQKVIDQCAIQMWPAWSPDGQHVAYTNFLCASECGRTIQELWITDPRGGWARQLLMTNSLCQQPAWSPDGKKIAFSSDMNGNFNIWVISMTNWKLEQITKKESLDVSPAWSPNGKKIAFVSTRSGIMEIWIKDLENGKLGRLRPFGDRDIECKDVAW